MLGGLIIICSEGCLHSKYLREIFDISPNGVDSYNDYNIGFEFKESFMINRDNIFFKVPEVQALNSDFFVFCVDTTEYYLVDNREILKRFKFNTKEKNANIRISTVRNLSEFTTFDVLELRDYINRIEVK